VVIAGNDRIGLGGERALENPVVGLIVADDASADADLNQASTTEG
jgi:hypothetical protein